MSCYAEHMKRFLSVLLLLLSFMPVAHASKDADKLIDALLGIGVNVLQGVQNERSVEQEGTVQAEAESAAQPAESAAMAGEQDDVEGAPRTWRDRGRDMLGNLVTGTVGGLGQRPLSEVLAGAVKSAVDVLIDEYKEQYKEEGRAYAREVGDKIVGRVLQDPQIAAAIYSLHVLCWGVIIYLTIVTLVVVCCLLHIRRTNNKVLAAIGELKALLPHSDGKKPENE